MTRRAEAPTVAVVGSLNLDIVVPVPRHPAPGETVLGGDHFRNPGGQGANQAVAAARLGRRVAMVGRVGDDDAGRDLVAALRADGVDTSGVVVTDGAPTGIALIAVDERGENAIVEPGGQRPGDRGRRGRRRRRPGAGGRDPDPTGGAPGGREPGGPPGRRPVVLNPAPAPPAPPPAELLAEVDVLVPNRGELAGLAGADVASTLEEVEAQARAIRGLAVVVTLGREGALVVEPGRSTHVPAPEVEAVDTTVAGDASCGALAHALVGGRGLVDAVRWAEDKALVGATGHGEGGGRP